MSGNVKQITAYFVNILTVSLAAFVMMNPIGIILSFFLTSNSRYDWGEFRLSGIFYITKLTIMSLLFQFLIVMIATVLVTKIIQQIRWYVLLSVFAFALLCAALLPQSEMYGLDIYFTNEFWSNYAIANAPLLLFAFFCALPLRGSLVPLPEGSSAAMSLITMGIVIYIAAIFYCFALIVLQPEWSDWFRFYSEFDNQGKGG